MKPIKSTLWALASLLGALFATAPTGALAGNIWLTGHDADFHCRSGEQCNHFGTALDFGRLDAPDPTKPLLFVTNNTTFSDLVFAESNALSRANNSVEGAGNPFPFVQVSADAAGFGAETLSTDFYSAIVFASHTSCGGCDMTNSGVDFINTRTADIESFFNAGGGLVYFAGANDRDDYYASIPIGATAAAVSPPFTLTSEGEAIGLLDPDDTNCCATHNSFALPAAGSPLIIAEFDSAGLAETLFAGDVTIGDGGFLPGEGDPGTPGVSVPEPGSLALLALGLIGMGAARRRS